MNFNELRELIAALNQTDISELTLKGTDFELTVRKGIHSIATEVASAAVPPVPAVTTPAAPIPSGGGVEIAPTAAEGARRPPEPPPAEKNWIEIKSPMVGTFYRASAPGESPFVQVGDRISAGQAVCIIEAMKLMNEIEAEVSGSVMKILVENAEPVDFDKPLMLIDPDG